MMGQRLSQRRTWDLRRVTELVFQEEVLQLAVFTRCTTVAIASSSSSLCTKLLDSGCGKDILANMVLDGEETLAEGLVVPQDLEHAVQEAIVLLTLVAQALCVDCSTECYSHTHNTKGKMSFLFV